MSEEHYTKESEGRIGTISTPEEARKAHHLATADPEQERADGSLTGPAHEEKYGLERASESADAWRAAGVHPTENRALKPGEDGYVDPALETADDSAAAENTAAPRAARK